MVTLVVSPVVSQVVTLEASLVAGMIPLLITPSNGEVVLPSAKVDGN